MVLASMNTGMRRGEVFKLRWRDVDLAQQVLTVRSASAKSEKRRDIFLNAEALATLEAWRGMCDPDTDLVFPGDKGKALTSTKRSWEAVLADAGIKGFRWHDLRHHFASKLAMAGVDLNTVCELLGHSDDKITQRYAHLAPSHKRKAIELLCAG
jgi:integrase